MSAPREDAASRAAIVAVIPCTEPITGGVRADLRIIEQLVRRGWLVDTVSLSPIPDRAPRYRWRDQLAYNLRLIRHVRRGSGGSILLEDQALSSAVVIFNWYATRYRGARVVLVAHHLVHHLFRNPARRLLHRTIEGAVARRADLIIAQSQSTRHELLAVGIPDSRIRVVSFGAGLSTPEAQVARDHHALPVRLISVGTVEPRKGLEFLIRALGIMLELDWTLDVVGALEPDYHRSLMELGRLAGVTSRIRFHGRVRDKDLEELMALAHVFVHPSIWEGFGLAVVEAMERGLPVVASDAGALPELVHNGRTGLLVPPGNSDALAHALRRVMAAPQLREKLGKAAATSVRDRYSWDETGRQVDAALRSL